MTRHDRVDGPALDAAARRVLAAAAAVNLVLAVAFVVQAPWALALVPWTAGRLSYLFVGSILAAAAAGVAWIAWSGEEGSLPAGFLTLAVTFGGLSGSLLVHATEPATGGMRVFRIACGALAVVNLGLWWRTRARGRVDSARLPPLVRASFVGFVGILLAVGVALILRADGVMPWPLDPDTSALAGWIFTGNACYFLYAVVRPRWDAARAQLWSFLAYDVVLIGPLLAHYPDAPPALRPNLLVYVAVLVYSGALAVHYVVLNPRTRGWGRSGDVVLEPS